MDSIYPIILLGFHIKKKYNRFELLISKLVN